MHPRVLWTQGQIFYLVFKGDLRGEERETEGASFPLETNVLKKGYSAFSGLGTGERMGGHLQKLALKREKSSGKKEESVKSIEPG